MKKGQTSLEFIVIIAVVLVLTTVFATNIFNTTDTIKSIYKVKLRTLDIINTTDSNALLLKIENTEIDSNLNLKLYLRGGLELGLSDQNYIEVINNIKDTTYYSNINLIFEYS